MAFGLDPMFVMALWTVTFLGAGWIMGPTLGGAIFRIANRSKLGAMQIVSCKRKDSIRVVMATDFRVAERAKLPRTNSQVPCRPY